MTNRTKTQNEIERRFNQFSKWETYGAAFTAMDNQKIRLIDIIAIAGVYGISEPVIRMRRLQWLAMAK
tara:strand:- start:735 stop:938 length:204 start_codon:yes stop_codon:yes gene_type:complete